MSKIKHAIECETPASTGASRAPMGLAEQTSSADFETLYARASTLIERRRAEIFAQNPRCGSCKEAIDTVDECSLVQLADEAGDYLVHRTTKCTTTSVLTMVDRYFNRAKKAVAV